MGFGSFLDATEHLVAVNDSQTTRPKGGLIVAAHIKVIFSILTGFTAYFLQKKIEDLAITDNDKIEIQKCASDDNFPSIAPTIIAASSINQTTINVKWNHTIPTEGWNGIPVGYFVHWGTGNKTVGVNQSSYNITGLQVYTVYTISVSGVTSVGPGLPVVFNAITGEGYNVTLIPTAPTGFPANISFFKTSHNSLNVTWSDISQSQRKGIIRGFMLLLYDVANQIVESRMVCSIARQQPFHNLKSYHNYSLEILGFTAVTYGPFSPKVFARTDESVPWIAPSNVFGMNLTGNSIYIEWSLINPQDYRVSGVLLGYRVFLNWADNDPVFAFRNHYFCVNVSSTNIDNLWPYTVYNISVAGFTKVGVGLASSILVRTNGEAPGKPPSSIKAYNTSSTTIRAEWGEVDKSYRHGEILGYKFTLSELLPSSATVKRTLGANRRTTLFDDLKEFTQYTFELLAFNKYGDGFSYMVFAQTRRGPLKQAPASLMAWNTSSTSLFVTWEPLNDTSVIAYLLSYKRADNNTTETRDYFTCNLTKLEIEELDKFTFYNISVKALNREGFGPASQSVLCKTDEDVPTVPPVNLRGFNTSKQSILIEWDPVPQISANGHILGYYITYKRINTTNNVRRKRRSVGTASVTVKVPVAQGNYTFQGLVPYSVYSVIMAAYTLKGIGHWSPVVYIRTDQEVPQFPPPKVSGFNTSSTSLNITWQIIPAVLVKGVMTSYAVRYVQLDKYGNNVTTQLQATVSASRLSIELTGLEKYTNYSVTVGGVTKDVGVESQPIIVRTSEDTPDMAPQNISFQRTTTSFSSLNLSWSPIPMSSVNGILRGLVIFYKKTNEFASGPNNTVILPTNTASYEVTNLAPSTSYSFWMLGYTAVGHGATSSVHLGTTDEDVPSQAPGNLTATNFSSDTSIPVSWSSIPYGHARGILRGYRVFYKQVQLAGEIVEDQVVVLTVGPSVLSIVIRNLDNFAVYQIKVLGFTIKGDGVTSDPVYAETCPCSKELRTSWHVIGPYVTHNESTSVTSGLIPSILEPVISSCCGNCYNGHGRSHIDYHRDDQGNSAKKTNITEFLGFDGLNTDLIFPVNGFDGKVMHGENSYVGIVTSPGVAFITTSGFTNSVLSGALLRAVLNSWTVIALMLTLVCLVGILTWILDKKHNPENFPASFIKGAYNGCWLAFITITTVGYGDCVPKGVCARVLTIVNALMGFVLVSLITANLSNDLVVTTVMADKQSLYMTKIGAITDSFEYRVGIRRNALVNTDGQYHSFEDLRRAMISEEVQGILVDLYVSANHQDLFKLPQGSAKISKLLKYDNIYGIALGGRSKKLQKCFIDYINFERENVFKIIDSTVSQPKVSPRD
ncbi:hypothetical protein QZH41_013442, partial [Actinostola sp. cb2023]